jgi:uncharacterized protein YkwD
MKLVRGLFGLALLVLMALLAGCGGGGSGFDNDGTAAGMLARINADRTASGLGTLSSNAGLAGVAQDMADYMASLDQLRSTNADGDSIPQQVADAGISAANASMTASGLTEQEVFERIQNEAGLRAVYNGVDSTAAGIGYAVSDDLQYWCIITAEIAP